jgi:hypothetical protein
MNSPLPRREFLKRCGQLGVGCACGCGLATALPAEDAKPAPPAAAPKLPALRTRAYCGLTCDDHCPLFKASVADDAAAKKKVFEEWHWREKFGVEFDAARVFCFGCKPDGKPRSISVSACTTRACSTDRGLESCLQCQRLAACDKSLWKEWPDFRKQMLELQRTYVAAGTFTLV